MSAGATFSITITDDPDRVVFVVTGDVDLSTATILRRYLERELRDGARHIAVDMAAVPFFDSSGIAALIAIRKAASDQGRRLTVIQPSRRVAVALELAGVSELFLSDDDDESRLGGRDAG